MTSSEKAEKLIMAHDGDMALLYIYFTKRNTTDVAKAAKDLFMTLSRAESAYEKLELQGFFDDAPEASGNSRIDDAAERAEDDYAPRYTSEDIAEASKDYAFTALLDEAQEIMGKLLTKDDMAKLLDIYKHLALPADTIFALMHYCEIISSRTPRMAYIHKIAYSWHQKGIITYEQAEAFIEQDLSRKSELGKIKSALHIFDRDFTTKERENANAWIDMGMSEDDVEEAYEICVDRNGKYANAYINKILINWHEKGKDSRKAQTKKEEVHSPLPKTIRKKPNGS